MCCGSNRKQLRTNSSPFRVASGRQPQTRLAVNAPPAPAPETASASSVYFEYIGKTGLTVISPITGKRYRFDQPGGQLPADPRDQALLSHVPNLRPVRVAHGR